LNSFLESNLVNCIKVVIMSKNLSHYRRNYDKAELIEGNLPKDPLDLFRIWFEEMDSHSDLSEVNAMTVSTIGQDGFPKSRVVLLKEFNDEGFTFYTNYTSEKAQALLNNPKVCISFFWPALERQVIIKGIAEKSSPEKSEAYFRSRPRGSQLGAWASNQSSEIASREVLEKSLQELEVKFGNEEIPKPDFWGGFIIKPENYEFWQGRPNRLHDRIYYGQINGEWQFNRLAP
jgi:pyridoxamine 5'-phosphate oxidase